MLTFGEWEPWGCFIGVNVMQAGFETPQLLSGIECVKEEWGGPSPSCHST